MQSGALYGRYATKKNSASRLSREWLTLGPRDGPKLNHSWKSRFRDGWESTAEFFLALAGQNSAALSLPAQASLPSRTPLLNLPRGRGPATLTALERVAGPLSHATSHQTEPLPTTPPDHGAASRVRS